MTKELSWVDPSESVVAGPLPEALVRELEELELSPYEARALLALLRLGTANSVQLARYSGVPRTSTYQVMDELSRKALVQRVSADGPAQWAAAGRDEVLDRLEALHEERLREQRVRTARVREMLAASFPEPSSATNPYVHVLQGAAKVSGMYERMLNRAQDELVIFNRPPYSMDSEQVSPAVIEAAERGVRLRALYEAAHWAETASTAFRATHEAYHRAGVEGALVDELPIKVAVADRSTALVVMTDPVLPDIGFPTTLLIEHPGFASLQAEAFDRRWEMARPIEAGADITGTSHEGLSPVKAVRVSTGASRGRRTKKPVPRSPDGGERSAMPGAG